MKSDLVLNSPISSGATEAPQVGKQIRKECLRLLTRRDHSRKQMQDKLAIKGYDPSEVSIVVDELAQENWQDDTRYAESYARVRSQKGFGPVRIAYELRQQGVEAKTVEQILRSMADNWLDVLRQVYNKKYPRPGSVEKAERAKRIRFLLQRGFSSSMINTLFD
jgi:regulatory protein